MRIARGAPETAPATAAPTSGTVHGAAVIPPAPLQGKSIALFPVGLHVNGLDESMYIPTDGLPIAGGS